MLLECIEAVPNHLLQAWLLALFKALPKDSHDKLAALDKLAVLVDVCQAIPNNQINRNKFMHGITNWFVITMLCSQGYVVSVGSSKKVIDKGIRMLNDAARHSERDAKLWLAIEGFRHAEANIKLIGINEYVRHGTSAIDKASSALDINIWIKLLDHLFDITTKVTT